MVLGSRWPVNDYLVNKEIIPKNYYSHTKHLNGILGKTIALDSIYRYFFKDTNTHKTHQVILKRFDNKTPENNMFAKERYINYFIRYLKTQKVLMK